MHFDQLVIELMWSAYAVVWLVVPITSQRMRAVLWQPNPGRMRGGIAFFAVVSLLLSRGLTIGDIQPPGCLIRYSTFLTVSICLMGITLAFWSRAVLKDMWSPYPTIVSDHRLVKTGPYRIVRHPMYLSQALMSFGTAWATRNLIVFAVFCIGLLVYNYLRSLKEDGILARHFGCEFADYKSAVPALIPCKRMSVQIISAVRKGVANVASANLSHNTSD